MLDITAAQRIIDAHFQSSEHADDGAAVEEGTAEAWLLPTRQEQEEGPFITIGGASMGGVVHVAYAVL